MECTVTVIVPCYNAERYLAACLESLSAQKLPGMEIILIDDGSKDATGAMLDEFARREPRAVVVHQENRGVSAARNRALAMARGRYIAFADADDEMEPGALEALCALALREDAEIVSANHAVLDAETGRREVVKMEALPQSPREIVREIIHMHRIFNNIWNKLFARELFLGLSLDENVRIGEDALLAIQLYLRAKRIAHLPETTYVYRVHSLSAMARVEHHAKAHQPMLRAMSAILLREGVKEAFFRDYLQTCVWIDEKEHGIVSSMKRFNRQIRPLAMEGLRAEEIAAPDRALYRLTKAGLFPAFYLLSRLIEKLTHKKWGIRR